MCTCCSDITHVTHHGDTHTHTLHVKVTLLTVLPTDKAVMKSCNKAVRKIHTEQRHTSHDPHTHFLLVSLFHLCEEKHPVGHVPHQRLPSLIGRTNAMSWRHSVVCVKCLYYLYKKRSLQNWEHSASPSGCSFSYQPVVRQKKTVFPRLANFCCCWLMSAVAC